MSQQTQYHAGKVLPLAKIIRSLVLNNPEAMKDDEYFKACLVSNIPDLKNREKCANCGASMKEYVYDVDFWNALLIKLMGDEVRRKVREGKPFTEANSIHVSAMHSWPHTAKCRTTQCAKLGLVAKQGGSHWAITRRGFEALRGQPVPLKVTVWRNQIEERHTEMTTLSEAFNRHRTKVEDAIKRRKEPKADHRHLVSDYQITDWVEFGATHQGNLI